MFRALAVLIASAVLALAPAAEAAPAASSHKPAHAKGAQAGAPTSKMARLHKAKGADDEAPKPAAKGRAGKHHAAAASEDAPAKAAPVHCKKGKKCPKPKASVEEAAPSKAAAVHCKKGRKCPKPKADEDEAAPAKAAPVHCKKGKKCPKPKVGEEDAAPAPIHCKKGKKCPKPKPSEEVQSTAPAKAHGRSMMAEADAAITARGAHDRSESSEHGLVIRPELRSTKACVAAHIKAHGKPKGARGRSALQRECAKEVEAARRRAEEERAIRTWMPPHGPLIYQGAMPRSGQPPAMVSEPPASGSPDAATPAEGPKSGPPPKGSAMVTQPASSSAQSGGFFSNLNPFRKRPVKPTATGPAPTLSALIGADETRLKAELGEPELMRAEGAGALWTYRLPACALVVFLSRDDTPAHAWKVKGAQSGPLKRGGPTPEVDVCLKGVRP